jgi:peptidoglycan hydrolase-like protein with peptidoglycan-binding domain
MRTVFENGSIIVKYAVDKLPKHRNFPYNWRRSSAYYKIKNRSIKRIYLHQKGGGYLRGFGGVLRTAGFFVRNPEYNADGKWTGHGRGWPGYAYTFDVPFYPSIEDGKIVIYQTNDFDWVTWHTSGDNEKSISIGAQGYFRSRHLPPARNPVNNGMPSEHQMIAIEEILFNFLFPELGLNIRDVRGHFEAPRPKASCPGDDIERWLMSQRGLIIKHPEMEPPLTALGDWKLRQAALRVLGHDIGTYGPKKNGVDGIPGEKTRLAIEAIERASGLESDGTWDSVVEAEIVKLLKRRNISQKDLYKLC